MKIRIRKNINLEKNGRIYLSKEVINSMELNSGDELIIEVLETPKGKHIKITKGSITR